MTTDTDAKTATLQDVAKRKTFGEIFRRETSTLKTTVAGPQAAGAQPKTEAIGLALSGGGIRSAAVALGVVQALAAKRAFHKIHYLSTVSGGGYTGGCADGCALPEARRFPIFDKQQSGRHGS